MNGQRVIRRKFDVGQRVRVGGDLGTITGWKGDNEMQTIAPSMAEPAHLVKLDEPVRVNPISVFRECWIHPDNLFAIAPEPARDSHTK